MEMCSSGRCIVMDICKILLTWEVPTLLYIASCGRHEQMTDPTSRQRGRPQMTRQKLKKKKRSLVKSPRLGSTPRLTDWLTVSRKVTLTLTWAWWNPTVVHCYNPLVALVVTIADACYCLTHMSIACYTYAYHLMDSILYVLCVMWR
jgi:hypothetical protein